MYAQSIILYLQNNQSSETSKAFCKCSLCSMFLSLIYKNKQKQKKIMIF